MDSCLSITFILCHIISKLNLREKFGVQGVCQRWKNIAIECLRHHEYLVITDCRNAELRFPSFRRYETCNKHPSLITVNKKNFIWSKHTDLELWQQTLSLLEGIKCVYIDVYTDRRGSYYFSNYKPILQLVMDYCGQSLECLYMPGHKDNEDETFPLTDSLPRLKHMVLSRTTSQVTKNILTTCPNLEYLRSNTSFTEWQMLPKGFKKLEYGCNYLGGRIFDGIDNLLSSPAVKSLEVVKLILMTSEINYQPYHLSCLKSFEVTTGFDVTNCLTHLARILSFAPVLREIKITMRASDEIQSQVWIKVLSECQNLTKLTVDFDKPYNDINIGINVSPWQDDFAKAIVSQIMKLEYLDIDFHLSSDGLRLLERLDNLKYFRHKLNIENIPCDSVFDTDALIDFLSSSFDKKLTVPFLVSIERASNTEGNFLRFH